MKKSITLKAGETFSFLLDSHTSGGYDWIVASNNEAVTEVMLTPTTTEQNTDTIPIGKSFPTKVEIKALAIGKSGVILEEKRNWENNIKPLNICKLSITVK